MSLGPSLNLLIVGFVASICFGAEQTPLLSLPDVSGGPGDSIMLAVNLSYNGGAQPAAVQWDLNYSTTDLLLADGAFFSIGAAASAAGKSVSCSVPNPGSIRCIVFGLNKNLITDGALTLVRFQIAPSTRNSSTSVSLSKTQGADHAGAPIHIDGAVATVAIALPRSL